MNICSIPHDEKVNVTNELHKQFAYPRSDWLITLVKDSGVTDNEFINSIRSVESSWDIMSVLQEASSLSFGRFFTC